ncbi:FadR/GntR family transcriptional regulator [Sneathiella chinensis]|uniref:GntR family transcriptional regulator n=1 Tax=Sneathiella chinensis TaxID=349750 RepID=A0ABQ5U5I8_9PROT|nr:FadR/GntR family transcriptional regulator [Sneathiella chinensis]GLQ06651.1 GntR family transcriptional regulator [Sneathiella chinensis]
MFEVCSRGYPETGIHGRVVHELGRDIVGGRFKPGEKLPEEAWMIDRFCGSRTAIREALRVLTAKGLLEARQRYGTSVREKRFWNLLDPDVLSWQALDELDEEAVRNLMEIRVSVAPLVARMVSERSTIDELRAINGACEAMEQAERLGNKHDFFRAAVEFNMCLFEACHNDFIVRLRDAIKLLLEYGYRQTELKRCQPFASSRMYRAVLEKIRKRDANGAELAMQSIIAQATEALEIAFAFERREFRERA